MDGRNTRLRPRTVNRIDHPSGMPEGWAGVDVTQQRQMDPQRTFETPLVFFGPDILIPPNTTMTVPLPDRCAQIAFINLVPGVFASINGGGGRTIKDGFVFNGDFHSLEVATDAAGSVTIQTAAW